MKRKLREIQAAKIQKIAEYIVKENVNRSPRWAIYEEKVPENICEKILKKKDKC